MYGIRQRRLGSRLAGAHAQRGSLGDIDWGSVVNNLITTGGKVASIAETPTPTTSIMYPSGASATVSGGALLPASLGSSITSSSLMPFLLLGGAVALIFALKR